MTTATKTFEVGKTYATRGGVLTGTIIHRDRDPNANEGRPLKVKYSDGSIKYAQDSDWQLIAFVEKRGSGEHPLDLKREEVVAEIREARPAGLFEDPAPMVDLGHALELQAAAKALYDAGLWVLVHDGSGPKKPEQARMWARLGNAIRANMVR
jgi:hypothetical protein